MDIMNKTEIKKLMDLKKEIDHTEIESVKIYLKQLYEMRMKEYIKKLFILTLDKSY